MEQNNVLKMLSQQKVNGNHLISKKKLTRAKYSHRKECCSKKSTKPGCARCNYIKESSFHTLKTTGAIFYFKEDVTFKSSNLVYVDIYSTCYEESI